MSDDFISNLTSITNNLGDITFNRLVTITAVHTDGKVDCKEDGGIQHLNVINSTGLRLNIDDRALVGFTDNNIYQPYIIGATTPHLDVVDNLTSTDPDKPLSANQGKTLADMIGEIQEYVNK